jgi:hypothetical protein
LKSTSGLCVRPCATSLDLYLTSSLFSFIFRTKTHLYPTGKAHAGQPLTPTPIQHLLW